MDHAAARQHMVEALKRHGIIDQRVLDAIASVPRHRFVSGETQSAAYDDRALPIGAGQTISQPYMVALMTQELRLQGPETVLEIGTGSGYQAAVLARLVKRVVTIERIPSLAERARRTLRELGISNVECHVGDGSLGWKAAAPYDGIVVTAGAPNVPESLYQQLRPEGRLVIPVSHDMAEMLQTVVRGKHGPIVTDVCECSFVPLLGESGWSEAPDGDPDE